MPDKQTGVLGRQPPDASDPQAIHTRALAGVLQGGAQQVRGAADTPADARFFQLLQQAAFGLVLPKAVTENQLKAIRELSLLADRASQLPGTEDDRNAVVRRLCGCIQAAVKLLDGNLEAAMRWMKTPNTVLDGDVPLEMALRSDDEAHEVEQLIGRIQYSVFA